MKKLTTLLLIPLFITTSCATATFFPALGNVHSYQNCDMVYESHVPGEVIKWKVAYEALDDLSATITQNPSVATTLLPSTSQWNAIGSNAAQLGIGAGTIVSSITNNATPYAMIGAAVTGGITALGNIRSEDRTQDRIAVCMPKDAKVLVFVNGDGNLAISKQDGGTANSDLKDLVTAMRTGYENEPNRSVSKTSGLTVHSPKTVTVNKTKTEVK